MIPTQRYQDYKESYLWRILLTLIYMLLKWSFKERHIDRNHLIEWYMIRHELPFDHLLKQFKLLYLHEYSTVTTSISKISVNISVIYIQEKMVTLCTICDITNCNIFILMNFYRKLYIKLSTYAAWFLTNSYCS